MKYLFGAVLLIVAFFAFSPESYTPSIVADHDKLGHFGAFFVLSFLLQWAFRKMPIYSVIMLMGLWAMGIEIIQLLFTQREFSWEDMFFSLLGTLCYVALVQCSRFRIRSRKLLE